MILTSIIGNSMTESARIALIMVILGILSWPSLARLVRAQVLAEREQEFVTAANAMGVKRSVIVFKHIIPNVISVIIVSATLDFAYCMLTESTLSFFRIRCKTAASYLGKYVKRLRKFRCYPELLVEMGIPGYHVRYLRNLYQYGRRRSA